MISELKKEARTMGPLRKNKKSPINSKAEGKKKGWPGEVKVLEKDPNQFEGAKKECPREVFSLLLGHSVC